VKWAEGWGIGRGEGGCEPPTQVHDPGYTARNLHDSFAVELSSQLT